MNRIKHYREKARLSQEELGKALEEEKTQGAMAHYEAGRRLPSLADCRDIVAVFNRHGVECSLDDVFPTAAKTGPSCIGPAATVT